MYSDAYLEVLGTESNLRQFEFGLRAMGRMGGAVRTFGRSRMTISRFIRNCPRFCEVSASSAQSCAAGTRE